MKTYYSFLRCAYVFTRPYVTRIHTNSTFPCATTLTTVLQQHQTTMKTTTAFPFLCILWNKINTFTFAFALTNIHTYTHCTISTFGVFFISRRNIMCTKITANECIQNRNKREHFLYNSQRKVYDTLKR